MFVVRSGSKRGIESNVFWKMVCTCGCEFVLSEDEFDHENQATGILLVSPAKCPECGKKLNRNINGTQISKEERDSLWDVVCNS